MFEAKITGPKETYGVWALLSGPYAITMSVCLIDLFQQNFNYKTVGFSIDQLVEQINFERPNYIKIDVDGIEHLILKGSTNTLKDVETILIEVNENYNEQHEKVSQYLISSGFTLKQKKQIQIKENSVSLPFFYNQIWIKK